MRPAESQKSNLNLFYISRNAKMIFKGLAFAFGSEVLEV
jgi:hypothetical protein